MGQAYTQRDEELEVPKGTGVPGLLKSIESIIKLGRVQQIVIKASGKIEYTYFQREDESIREPKINFEELMPYAIVRNAEISELPYPKSNAAVVCAELFYKMSIDHLHPIAFLGGANSFFWQWFVESTNLSADFKDELFGLPFLYDRHMEDTSLLLCAAYKKDGVLVDTVKSYKVTIPRVLPP